ncbi:MAG: rhomboid family intramembrane serine protease [Flavobacteriales bacterium]|nr:rhomboid family intramembrane serine protease [Flavobacteriales bacterium]|tara:strand:+ start:26 stop:856 length:831 start_codon:yes stop_codon:yes gene_type:complete
MNFLDNLKREFGIANMLNKLIYINVFSFLVLNIFSVIFSLLLIDISSIKELLMLPSSTEEVIKKPWSLISYMFIHDNFIHLLFNLIWLHFGGKLFLQYLNQKQLLYTYILGGLFGGILFIIAFNNLPALIPYSENAKALGASASVLAIFFAIATYIPNFQVSIPFIGFIKLKHIALIYIILDFLNIPNGNAGGHIAHLGGAIFGFFYVKQFTQKSAKNKQNQFLSYLKNIFNFQKSKNKKSYKMKEIDLILEKISKSGYNSLTKIEKELLFKSSKK